MNFVSLMNIKIPTIVGILTCISISRTNDWLWGFKPEISIHFGYFKIYELLKFHAQHITSGPVLESEAEVSS